MSLIKIHGHLSVILDSSNKKTWTRLPMYNISLCSKSDIEITNLVKYECIFRLDEIHLEIQLVSLHPDSLEFSKIRK